MKEEWRDIKGYEGLYQVSNLGRVKSFKDNNGKYREKILKPKPKKDGYIQVKLYKNGVYRIFKVHRLVAQTFIENPNNYSQVNHKDEDKTNNKVENLEWCTAKYNINYGTHNKRVSESSKGVSRNKYTNHPMYGKHHTKDTKDKISKTLKESTKFKGSNHPNSKRVLCITTNRVFNCIQEAGEYYNIKYSSRIHISDCCQGKRNYCGKHPVTGEKLVWRYIDE